MRALIERLELRQLWLLGCGALAVLAAGVLTHGVMPQLKAWRSAVSAQSALEAARAGEPSLDEQLTKRNEEVAELGRRLHDAMADVPPRELEAVVVGRLQSVSWRHEVELVSVRPGRGATLEHFEEMLFEVELAGRYQNLYAWLEDLRSEIGFAVIQSYAIRRAEQDAGPDPELRATLTLASYRALGT
jgi:hypothetical protein